MSRSPVREPATPPATGEPDGSISRDVALAVFASVVGILAVLYLGNAARAELPWINHDVAFHSYMAEGILAGQDVYIDLQDDNPPGSPLLLTAVLAVGQALGLPDFSSQHALVLLLGVLGAPVLWFAFRRGRYDLAFAFVCVAYALVLSRSNFSNSLFRGAPDIPYGFGQREQLFSLLFVPYVAARLSGRRTRLWLYPYLFLLGYVAAFKPYWPVMVGIVELALLRRPFLSEWKIPAALGAGMLSTLVALLVHSRASFTYLFREIIPTYLAGGFADYNQSVGDFVGSALHRQMLGGWLLLAVGASLCAWRRSMPARHIAILLLSAAAAYLSVFHQRRFWSYHAMPFFAFSITFGGWLLGRFTAGLSGRRARRAVAAGVLAVAILANASAVRSTWKMLEHYPPLGSDLVQLVERYERPMFFSMSVIYCYAPLLLDRPILWPWIVNHDLPALLRIEDREERAAALGRYSAGVRRAIETARPDIILIGPYRDALPPGVTLDGVLTELQAMPTDYEQLNPGELWSIDPRLAGWIALAPASTPQVPASDEPAGD